MRSDCEVCRSEGFEAQARVELSFGGRSVIATVHRVMVDWLAPGETGLSEASWRALGLAGGEPLVIRHPPVLESQRHIRSKIYGASLDYAKLLVIMRASGLSKKAAAGSPRALIDIPVGPTAKVRSAAAARELSELLQQGLVTVGDPA